LRPASGNEPPAAASYPELPEELMGTGLVVTTARAPAPGHLRLQFTPAMIGVG
jgi:hypothetical protein